MVSIKTRLKIQNLRSKGYSYREICEEVGDNVPKSTLSYICKNILMPDDYYAKQRKINLLNLEFARRKAFETNTKKYQMRLRAINQNAKNVFINKSKINLDKINLAILYKAEGSKYASYRGLSLGSSDPSILRMYIRLLQTCYSKKIDDFRARIQYRADQDILKLREYWSEQLGINPDAFYKSTPDMRSIGKN